MLRPTGSGLTADVAVPRTGLWIRSADATAKLAVHRFSPYPAYPLGQLSPKHGASLVIPADTSPTPWRLRVNASGRVTVCSH